MAGDDDANVIELLNSRETDVLTSTSIGQSINAIARQLHLKQETVKWNLMNLLRKLNADSRTGAICVTVTLGLSSTG